MSNWRRLLQDMADAGGENIQASSLPGWGITNSTQQGRRDLSMHGLIKPVGSRRHSITPQGWRVLAGAADLVEPKFPGKVGHKPRAYSLVVRGDAVPDIVIEDLLTQCGLQPGAAISPEIIRAYSAKLAAVVRGSA
jgi:hypothetical protein